MSRVSGRGKAITDQPLAGHFAEHSNRQANLWSPTNHDGYIPLCIAENKLMWDVLSEPFGAPRSVPARVAGYDDMTGSEDFRISLAAFLGSEMLGREIAPDQVTTMAGASAILEAIFYTLCDPGDVVLVPTPSYSGFWLDLETRAGVNIVTVPTTATDGFRVTPDLLDLVASGRNVRAVLLTNPDNPSGRVRPPDEVGAVLGWCDSHDVHLVVDEIYALSVHGSARFHSAASLRPDLGDNLHIVWAVSKDLGLSGLRCGVLVSDNQAIRTAMARQAMWGAVSGDTQFLIQTMLTDRRWMDHYLSAMRGRLADAYRRTTDALDRHHIAYHPADAGFFLLVDFRDMLDTPTEAAAESLWREFIEHDVNLTPSSAIRSEPGVMRLCFASIPIEAVETAIERMGAVLGTG